MPAPSRSPRIRLSALLLSTALALIFCSPGNAQKSPPAKPLDLNSATAAELQQVPGIGPSTAQAIVRMRQKSGPFRRLEDLLAIHGISHHRLENMRPYLVVVQPTQQSSNAGSSSVRPQ